MNVTETSTSLIPNSSIGPSNGSQPNSTQSNSTQPGGSESDSTQRLWDLRWFGILSAPLLFATILLPLIFGPSIRWLLQTYLQLRRFWRFSIVPVVVVYYICYYIYLNDHRIVNEILYRISDYSVLSIGLIRCMIALVKGEKRKRWSLFVVFTTICAVVDELVTEPVMMGTFAWAGLALMFLTSHGYFERTRLVLRRTLNRLAGLFVR